MYALRPAVMLKVKEKKLIFKLSGEEGICPFTELAS